MIAKMNDVVVNEYVVGEGRSEQKKMNRGMEKKKEKGIDNVRLEAQMKKGLKSKKNRVGIEKLGLIEIVGSIDTGYVKGEGGRIE